MLRRSIPPILLALAVSTAARAEIEQLTLFQRTGRAPVVVWGEVVNHDNQKALVRTLEVIKCNLPAEPPEVFRIAFRLDSFTREYWEDSITFEEGEQVVLFLKRPEKASQEEIPEDLFNLMWGADGKFALPPEGAKAYIDAIRFFEEVATEKDLDRQETLLIGAVPSDNPYIVIGSFEEMLRMGIGDLDMLPDLVGFFDEPRDDLRVLAMRQMQRVLSDAEVAGRTVPQKAELGDRVRGRAVLDPSADFRVEAVKVLGLLGGEESRALLERLSKEDPDQHVRYEAGRLLIGWKPGV